MKHKSNLFLAILFSSCSLGWVATTYQAAAQGTAFTYQGRLLDDGCPAAGIYDVVFSLFDAGVDGNEAGPALTRSTTIVRNRLFSATLDFGSVFDGTAYWLEIAVQTNGGAAFATLSPRQPITPAPYSVTAANLSGSLPASQLIGTLLSPKLGGVYSGAITLGNAANSFNGRFTGDGSGLAGCRCAATCRVGPENFWQITGNNSTTAGVHFLGTSYLRKTA